MIAVFRNLFVNNLGTWLMSLFLAVLLWGVLVMAATGEKEVDVPVRVENFDPEQVPDWNLRDSRGIPLPKNEIRIKLTGPKGVLNTLNPAVIECVLRVNMDRVLSENPIPLTFKPEQFTNIPEEIRVAVPEEEFELWTDPLLERRMKLGIPKAVGKPAPGYTLEGITVSPTEVRVRILRSRWESRPRGMAVALRPVSIQQRAEDVVVQAEPAEPGITILDRTEVRARIVLRKIRRDFQNIPIHILHSPELKVGKVVLGGANRCTVTVEGKDILVDRLDPGRLKVYVLLDRDSGTFTAKLQCHLQGEAGADLQVVRIDPEEVTIEVAREP